jgi:hypothetical protein
MASFEWQQTLHLSARRSASRIFDSGNRISSVPVAIGDLAKLNKLFFNGMRIDFAFRLFFA